LEVFWHLDRMQSYKVDAIDLRAVRTVPTPIKEPPDAPETPDVPVREPDPAEPDQI
jgi:hypothetical protein